MICTKPYFTGTAAYGCGQCVPCRINRRRIWAHRIMLEAFCHAECSFVTLTYADNGQLELEPRHLQLFIKRLRKNFVRSGFRYYAVGEYGDRSGRPHYHLAAFGFPSCRGSEERLMRKECTCAPCSAVRKTWGFGLVSVDTLSPASASYLAGYVTKKMTMWDDVRLNGRHPEFSRMSLNPGIGAPAMWDAASVIIQYNRKGVPTGMRHGSVVSPLGRYLRGKLAKMADLEIQKEYVDERLQLVRAYAFDRSVSVQSVWSELAAPFAQAAEGRLRLKKERQI